MTRLGWVGSPLSSEVGWGQRSGIGRPAIRVGVWTGSEVRAGCGQGQGSEQGCGQGQRSAALHPSPSSGFRSLGANQLCFCSGNFQHKHPGAEAGIQAAGEDPRVQPPPCLPRVTGSSWVFHVHRSAPADRMEDSHLARDPNTLGPALPHGRVGMCLCACLHVCTCVPACVYMCVCGKRGTWPPGSREGDKEALVEVPWG